MNPGNRFSPAKPFCQHERGSLLFFQLDGKSFAMETTGILDWIGLAEVRPYSHEMDRVKGMIKMRGRAFPVLDLGPRFGLDETDLSDLVSVLIVDLGSVEAALVIDRIDGVWPPHFEGTPEYTRLEIRQVLSEEEIASLGSITPSAAG